MEIKDFGKPAVCGINNKQVIVSVYNYKCTCLNCQDCAQESTQCQWKYILETNPCINDDMKMLLCKNCMNITNEKLK